MIYLSKGGESTLRELFSVLISCRRCHRHRACRRHTTVTLMDPLPPNPPFTLAVTVSGDTVGIYTSLNSVEMSGIDSHLAEESGIRFCHRIIITAVTAGPTKLTGVGAHHISASISLTSSKSKSYIYTSFRPFYSKEIRHAGSPCIVSPLFQTAITGITACIST